jgi:hypothetical protein
MRARTIAKIAGVVLGVLVIGGVAAAVAWYRSLHQVCERSTAAARASLAAHHDEFMQDQARLARLPILAPRPGGREAGPVIGPRLTWTVLVPGAVRDIRPPENAVDAAATGEDWVHTTPDAWARLDFAWMARLRDLDTWDLSQGGPPDDPKSYKEPAPSVVDLTVWGRLRIAKGVREGTPLPALAEVEELARLCFTTDLWEVQLAGLGLLGIVDRTRELVPAAAAYTPAASPEDREVMRRALSGALAFARLETPARYDAEVDRLVIGKCAALHDGAWLAYLLRPELGEARGPDYARLEHLLAAHPECPLRTLRARWDRPPDPHWHRPTRLVDRWTSWIPAVRRIDGELMLAISDQHWFSLYERNSRGQ